MGAKKVGATKAVVPVKKVGRVVRRLPARQRAEELRAKANRIELREKISLSRSSNESVRVGLEAVRGLKRVGTLPYVAAPLVDAANLLVKGLQMAIEAEVIRLDKAAGHGLLPGVG